MNRLAPFFAVVVLFCILSAGCASLNGTGQIYQPVAAPGRTIQDAARQLINDLADGRAVWILANGSWVPVKCTIENNLIKLHRQDNGQVIIGLYSYRLMDRKIVLTSSMAPVLEIGDLVKLRFSSVMGTVQSFKRSCTNWRRRQMSLLRLRESRCRKNSVN